MSLRFALLGLLSIRPMSGYELKKAIDGSVGHFWTADQSQIYRTLARLVEEGFASRSTVRQDARPNRHPHAITPLGTRVLDAWLDSPLDPEVTREPFLVRLFFAGRTSGDRVWRLLEKRRWEVEEKLAALEDIPVPDGDRGGLDELLRLATLENGIAHARAELEWVESLLPRLEVQT